MLRHLSADIRLTWQIVWRVVFKTPRLYSTIGLFIILLFMLQWLLNIDEFRFIVFDNMTLSNGEKIEYFIDAFFNIFQYANAITPVAMIIIASLQAISISLLLVLYRLDKQTGKQSVSQLGTLLVGVIGAGCVACGGSLLTPVLAGLASVLSVSVAQRAGSLVLIGAIILSYLSLSKIAFRVAQETHKI